MNENNVACFCALSAVFVSGLAGGVESLAFLLLKLNGLDDAVLFAGLKIDSCCGGCGGLSNILLFAALFILLFDSLNGILFVLAIKFSFFLSKFDADEDELTAFWFADADEEAEDDNIELDADECNCLFAFKLDDTGCCCCCCSVDNSVGFLNVNMRFIIFFVVCLCLIKKIFTFLLLKI
jgi:hypothetical protein